MEYYEATLEEEPVYEAELVEAKVKPEQVRTVTPTAEGFDVTPDPGCVLRKVTVEPIPALTAEDTAAANGDYDVERLKTLHVQVPQGVFPAGELLMDRNGTEDCSGYASVRVAVPERLDGAVVTAERKRVTVTEAFAGTLNQVLAALFALATQGGESVAVNVDGMLYVGLVSADGAENQLVTWGGHYNSGVRSIARRYNANGQVTIQSSPAVNSYMVTLPAGAVYDVLWLEVTA